MKTYKALHDLLLRPPRCKRRPRPKALHQAGDLVRLDPVAPLVRWWLKQGWLIEVDSKTNTSLK